MHNVLFCADTLRDMLNLHTAILSLHYTGIRIMNFEGIGKRDHCTFYCSRIFWEELSKTQLSIACLYVRVRNLGCLTRNRIPDLYAIFSRPMLLALKVPSFQMTSKLRISPNHSECDEEGKYPSISAMEP